MVCNILNIRMLQMAKKEIVSCLADGRFSGVYGFAVTAVSQPGGVYMETNKHPLILHVALLFVPLQCARGKPPAFHSARVMP